MIPTPLFDGNGVIFHLNIAPNLKGLCLGTIFHYFFLQSSSLNFSYITQSEIEIKFIDRFLRVQCTLQLLYSKVFHKIN